jgi:uncharacterized protein involved in exopolysaccharide biosynthesis
MPDVHEPPVLDLVSSLKKPLRWALAAGVLTGLYTLSMPDFYRSEARFLPVESKGAGGNLGGLAAAAAAFGVSVPGGDSGDANFVDILSSRWLKEQLLQTEFQYHTRSWRFGAVRVEKGTLYSYLGASNADRAIQGVNGILFVSRDPKSKVISISAETRSPELSQCIVQRAGKLLEVFLQEKGRTRGGAKAAFAESRLADARRGMDEAEELLCRFLESNRNFQTSSDPSVRLKGARLETELRLRQQLVTSIALNREQALLEEKNDIPILNMLDPAYLPIDKSKPIRSVKVLLAMVLAGAGTWIWLNREWIRAKFLAEDHEVPPTLKENP